jgi:hypothetical protein
MGKKPVFRAWFYFRMGWSLYFAFILAAINTLVVTYYLAIDKASFLKEIFPSFTHYLIAAIGIGIPVLVLIGYLHFKKSPAYTAEADVGVEAFPYHYKLLPGYNKEVVFPLYLMLTQFIIKIANNEKLTEEELKQLNDIQNKIKLLLEGGQVGSPKTFK